MPIHKKLTVETLKKHLLGQMTVGSYVIREDGLINFAVIDIDGDPAHLDLSLTLAYFIIPLFPEYKRCLEFSGRKGYHIWIFPKKPEHPAFLRELVHSRLRAKGLMNIEVFPKQDSTAGLGKRLGNLMKTPGGIHLGSGKRSKVLEWRKPGI